MNKVNREIVYGIFNIVIYGSWQRKISWIYFLNRDVVQPHSLRKIRNANAMCFWMENYPSLFDMFLLQCIIAMYKAVK